MVPNYQSMKLYTIDTGHFKLDGGAMFGVVPKSLWQKHNPADSNNLCSWAMRCLLVEDGDRLILIDNGMGDKQDEKFFGFYFLHGEGSLHKSLAAHGFTPADITDVVLTHLHFDHCGGSVKWTADRSGFELVFPKAKYWIHSDQYHWAYPQPNAREKASFLKDNIQPIVESGHAVFIKDGEQAAGLDFLRVDGHTEGMMLPLISYQGQKILYCADLLPSIAHLPLPWIMAYDMRPLETLKEKTNILARAAAENWLLYFEHDPQIELCSLVQTDKGVRADQSLRLADL